MAQNIVKHTFNVSQNADAKEQPVTLTYDFSNVTQDQLIAIALRQLTVSVQGQMRSATTRKEKPLTWAASVATFNGKTVKVAEMLKNARASLTPVDRAKKMVSGMSEAQRAALIAELTKGNRK